MCKVFEEKQEPFKKIECEVRSWSNLKKLRFLGYIFEIFVYD